MAVKVRKRGKDWWLYIDHQGKRRARKVGDKKAAEQARIKIEAALAAGDFTVLDRKPAVAVPTFGDVAEEWLDRYPRLHSTKPITMETYSQQVRVHLLPAFGERPITDLTWKVIEDFIAAKRATGSMRHPGKSLSDVTLRAVLLPLRLILQYAVRCRHIPSNPMHEVEWKPERHHETVDPFTPVELRAIVAAARDLDPDLAVMLELWMRTGARAGEVMGLQNHDIDPQAGTVLIRRTWTRHRLGSTKTGRERTVSYLHPVCENTPEWRPQGNGHALLAKLRVRSTEPEAFVFIRNGQPWGSKTLNIAWHRALTKARVRYRPPEQLRHTFASTMLSRNAPLLYVQRCGGWRSASVLLSVYARWMPQDGVQAPVTSTVAPALTRPPAL